MDKIAAAKTLLRRARLNDPTLSNAQLVELFTVAALTFPEGSKERASAEHNAFILKEAAVNQQAFHDLIDDLELP